jgi:hypothetical protein
MIVEKKYFSITEVSNLTGLSAHKLRYIEKSNQDFSIIKMRGRRYYTKESISYLKQNYSMNLIVDTDCQVELDKDEVIETDGSLSEQDLVDYKTIFPQQLNLGIDSFSKCFMEEKEESSPVQSAESQAFTEMEFQEESIILRIDLLLGKLYKLTK